MENQTVRSGGTSVFTLLGILFIILKLCGVITWSWWLVTLPLWGGLALFLAFLIIVFIVGVIVSK